MRQFLNNRRVRYGSTATAITLLFVAIVVLLNWTMSLLAQRYDLSIDMTPDSVFELSDESIQFVQSIDRQVDIYVLNSKETFAAIDIYFYQADQVFNQYARNSDNIDLHYVDMLKDPAFQTRYSQLELYDNDVLLVSGDRIRQLEVLDLFNVEEYIYGDTINYSITSSRAEQAMTTALMGVTSDEEIVVTALSGHGENTVTTEGLLDMLERNNYTIVERSLVSEEIPPESKLVVIAAPVRDYEESDLMKLQNYLDAGGTIFYIADYQQPELPVLESFLTRYGIHMEPGIVFEADTSRNIALDAYPFFAIVDYAETYYSQSLSGRNLVCVMPYARPFSISTTTEGYVVAPLLRFSGTSGIMPVDADENWQPGIDDMTGSIPALALSVTSGGGKILVSGSLAFVDSNLLSSTSINNAAYLLNIVNDLTERQESFSVLPKVLGGSELAITMSQITTLGLLFMAILPLVVLGFGIVVWLRRKNR